MTKHRRLLSLLLCLWMLLPLVAVFSVPASAAGAEEMDVSDVVDDLNVMGVDFSKYPANAADDRVEIIKFLEFGYKANGDYSEYGLYLYLYNPCGKAVTGGRNAVQLAYGLNAGGVTSYIKYRLTVLSRSTGSGRENVLLKVKVEGAEAIAPMLNKAARQYRISGVEILRPGNANATDYNYGVGTFTFTGYHKGCQSNDYSTLRCIADKLDVVELELHPVSYFADETSLLSISDLQSKGSEVFGVYFSVPKWVIEKYGNANDDRLRGLVSVAGDYTEVHVNGILTDSNAVQNAATDHNNFYFLSRFYRDSALGDSTRIVHCAYNYPEYQKSRFFEPAANNYVLSFSDFMISAAKTVDGISAQAFLAAYRNSGIDWNGKMHKKYRVTETDKATITQGIMLGEWFKNLFSGKGGSASQTQSFDLLTRLPAQAVGSLSDKAISETYLVNEAEADGLKKFATSRGAKGENVYLMRFAVRDYEVDRLSEVGIKGGGKYNKVDVGNSYYFEKTVFEDFDILELTFRNEENKLSVVPVSASPIDVTGGIPAPGQSNPNAKPSDTSFWRTLLKVVAVILVIVLLIFAVRLFGGFGKLFGTIGRGLTKGYRSAQKQIRTWKARRKKNAPKQKKPKKKKSKQKKENES